MSSFVYRCSSCGAGAKKPACERPKARAGGAALATLGSWRCTGKCPGKVSVKRSKD